MAEMKHMEKWNNEFLAKAVIKLMKNDIFRRYKETGGLTNEDWEFCERTDWHPVDEMPLKEGHMEKLKTALKEPSTRYQSAEEFFESIK